MGRSSKEKGGIEAENFSLWSDEELPKPAATLPEKNFKSLRYPVWTQNKANLIREYLKLFVYVTKHGTYIDGFAAPQAHQEGMWAAKLVLESEPKWFREFWLCDISKEGIKKLEALKAEHAAKKRRVEVLPGDFNVNVHKILSDGSIKESTATFALLDQRTFECAWDTVVALSRHKKETKIEIFYFFATGWIDRSLGALKRDITKAKVRKWWGRDDYAILKGMDSTVRAKLVAKRFEEELGYKKATVFPIHSERRGGRVMYHMIHATDHPEATPFMVRAYRKVSGRSDLEPEQIDIEEFLKNLDSDSD